MHRDADESAGQCDAEKYIPGIATGRDLLCLGAEREHLVRWTVVEGCRLTGLTNLRAADEYVPRESYAEASQMKTGNRLLSCRAAGPLSKLPRPHWGVTRMQHLKCIHDSCYNLTQVR